MADATEDPTKDGSDGPVLLLQGAKLDEDVDDSDMEAEENDDPPGTTEEAARSAAEEAMMDETVLRDVAADKQFHENWARAVIRFCDIEAKYEDISKIRQQEEVDFSDTAPLDDKATSKDFTYIPCRKGAYVVANTINGVDNYVELSPEEIERRNKAEDVDSETCDCVICTRRLENQVMRQYATAAEQAEPTSWSG